MHDYAIEGDKRRLVNAVIIGIYILVVCGLTLYRGNPLYELEEKIQLFLTQNLREDASVEISIIFLKIVFSTFVPGIGIGVVYAFYDHFLWKWRPFTILHNIPDLNGKWVAEISCPLKGEYHPKINMEIRQTWNRIQVCGISEHGTSTFSESASILEQHGQLYFSYSYWIHQFGGQCYPGFNSLKVEENRLSVQYFSAKNIENEFRENGHFMQKKTKKQVLKLAKGCGSKGTIVFRKL